MLTDQYYAVRTSAFPKEGEDDHWLRAFFLLHVPSNFSSDRQFKVDAVTLMREHQVYKKAKVDQAEVEASLVGCRRLSPAAFCALATCFHVSAVVVLKRFAFRIGADAPRCMVDARPTSVRVKPFLSGWTDDLLQIGSLSKPLYAVSHYSLAELENMVAAARTGKGSKQHMHNGLCEYVKKCVTDFSA